MMKKAFLLLTIICLPLFASAQMTEKQYYIYNIATFYGSMNNKNISVYLDDGKNVKMLKDEDGEKIRFYTQAAALMYLNSLGWELYVNGTTVEDEMFSDKKTNVSYWVIRKPCTKDELDAAVRDGIKHKK